MLCTCPVRSVGSLSRTCFRNLRFISDVQVFILHGLPRGRRTHGERISAKIDTTVGYGQRGQPVPVLVPVTVVASGYFPRWVLYLFTAYGTLRGGPSWIHIYCLFLRFVFYHLLEFRIWPSVQMCPELLPLILATFSYAFHILEDKGGIRMFSHYCGGLFV